MKGFQIALLAAVVVVAVLPEVSSSSLIAYQCGWRLIIYPCGSGWWWGSRRSNCVWSYRWTPKICYKPRPVDGGWTDWEDWENKDDCPYLCGQIGKVKQERSRSCSNPAPAYGGAPCKGDSHQTRIGDCGDEPCGDRCPQGQVKYFAHPSNKTRFYQCGNSIGYLHECGPGTVFNSKTSTCDHAPTNTCNEDGMFPSSDCRKYTQCVHGRSYERSCAPGTKYDAETSRCVHGDC